MKLSEEYKPRHRHNNGNGVNINKYMCQVREKCAKWNEYMICNGMGTIYVQDSEKVIECRQYQTLERKLK